LRFSADCESPPGGPTLWLHIGLEHVDDLKADLERGFAAFNAV
jgi:cystathionine beta-lyase